MEYGFTTAAYVVAAVLFIQSLGGLSGQESAKRAVWYGIMASAAPIRTPSRCAHSGSRGRRRRTGGLGPRSCR